MNLATPPSGKFNHMDFNKKHILKYKRHHFIFFRNAVKQFSAGEK